MSNKRFDLSVDSSGTGLYLKLPGHPRDAEGSERLKTVELFKVLGSYEGPEVIFDFDSAGVLVGIEVILDEPEDGDD